MEQFSEYIVKREKQNSIIVYNIGHNSVLREEGADLYIRYHILGIYVLSILCICSYASIYVYTYIYISKKIFKTQVIISGEGNCGGSVGGRLNLYCIPFYTV